MLLLKIKPKQKKLCGHSDSISEIQLWIDFTRRQYKKLKGSSFVPGLCFDFAALNIMKGELTIHLFSVLGFILHFC